MYALLFDLDGVLVDSKITHFDALNLALTEIDPWFAISPSEQAAIYEGLTTKDKLDILHRLKGLSKKSFNSVWESKQRHTATLFENIDLDQELVEIFSSVKALDFSIGVVSNSIRQTLDVCLSRLGVAHLVDVSVSNEDVSIAKPNPEGYLLAMSRLGVSPRSTAIFEDSAIGIEAATKSGALVVPVTNRRSITLDSIDTTIKTLKAGKK